MGMHRGAAYLFGDAVQVCKTTPMLHDTPLGIPGLAAGNAPYSLGKVQMAFWFSIILASHIFIWLITDNYELITIGILVLIGIGAGNGLGAVSNNKADKTIKQVQDLQAQQAELRQVTDLLKAALPAAGVEAKIGYNNFLDCHLTLV